MDIKQEHIEAFNMFGSVVASERAKAVFDFAMKRGLEKAVVTCPDGSEHAAMMYAWQLYCNTDKFAGATADEAEIYQIVSLMSAMEEVSNDTWSYGTKLLCDMRAAGIGPSRREYTVFLALEGSWDNTEKSVLLETEPVARWFYAGRLLTMCSTLPGLPAWFKTGTPIELPQPLDTPAATIQDLALKFIPACVGRENEAKILGLLKMLAFRSDFYTSAGSSEYEEGYLARHTLDVIYKLVEIARPAAPEQIGACVLAGLGHDLAEIKIFAKDAEGNAVFDLMPYGHGRKSVYILGGYLGGSLPLDVAAAIDVHMNDIGANPCSPLQMMEAPLGLYLHIADVLATYQHIEKNK